MNRPAFIVGNVATPVDRFAKYVEDSSESSLADGNGQRLTSIDDSHAATHTVSASERHAANSTAAKVLLDFARDLHRVALNHFFDLQSIINIWQMAFRKLSVKR